MATGVIIGIGGGFIARGYFKGSTFSYICGGLFLVAGLGILALKVHMALQ